MKTPNDNTRRDGVRSIACSGFSAHELDCCQAAAFAVDHGEMCYLPREDMDMLAKLGIIEFCPPPEECEEAEWGYMMTGYGEALANRIRNVDIIPNAQDVPTASTPPPQTR